MKFHTRHLFVGLELCSTLNRPFSTAFARGSAFAAKAGVNSGLITTTVDFGAGTFTGTIFWLDISVRTNGGSAFTSLSPRQPNAPAPYAVTAANLAGVMENNAIQNGVSLAMIRGGGQSDPRQCQLQRRPWRGELKRRWIKWSGW